jgi:carboxyl-terminal processing protease
MSKSIIHAAIAASAIALIPATTASMAAVDAKTWREFDQFLAVFEEVKSKYVVEVDDEVLLKGAMSGMLAALDPHSSYLDERDMSNLRTQTEGAYGGLGLTVSMEDGVVKVIAPIEDTPGYRVGIKAGDYISQIDGKNLIGATLDEAVDQMRGRPGSSITITIVRPGRDKPFDVTMTRENIEIKPVKWEVKDRVGIININSFMPKNTAMAVRAAIIGIEKSQGGPPLGYVVDLRSNPGGLLDQAVDVSDVFLERGEVVSQRGRDKNDIERFFAKSGDMARGLPIVVLIDAGSASAAEIVAGALQDHHRAVIIGERSFGKGSVQSLLPLDEKTGLRLTTARYYTPSGRSVQEGGIEPDLPVPQLSDPDYKTRPRLREADLNLHLINGSKVDNSKLEGDAKADPRFTQTADQLKKAGITDFQLDYAVKAVVRSRKPVAVANAGGKPGGRR